MPLPQNEAGGAHSEPDGAFREFSPVYHCICPDMGTKNLKNFEKFRKKGLTSTLDVVEYKHKGKAKQVST